MKRNYFYNLLLTVFNLLIPVITFPYVARVLGPAGVGKVQFIMTLCQYIALLAALGIPIYGVREIAKVKDSPRQLAQTIKELLFINTITAAVLFLLYETAVFSLPFFRADQFMFALAGVIILLGFTSVEWLFSGLEQFKNIALRAIVVRSLSLALILLFVRDSNDLQPYLLASMFGIVANNALNIGSAVKMMRIRTSRTRMKKHIRPLLYLLGTTIASTLYTTFDSIILGFISGDKSVGLYTAATRLTKIAIPVITAYSTVLLPQITRSVREEDHETLRISLNKSYAYIVMLAVPLCCGLFVFAPTLMLLFCGSEFGDAVHTMRVMSFLPLLIGLGYFWGYQVILPMGHDRYLFISAIAGMVVSIILNFVLIPLMEQNGAAIANVASEVIVTACYFLLIRKFLPVSIKLHYLRDAILASFGFFLFLVPARDYLFGNEILSMLAGGVASMSVYMLMQMLLFKNSILREGYHQMRARITAPGIK